MNINCIAFIGDSYTWGEGLEFYQEIPKWVEQRQKPSNFPDYKHLIDSESSKFRKSNRFANIVSNHFNKELITDSDNGGSIISFFRNLSNLYNKNITNSIIVIQFSSFDRNSIHAYNSTIDNFYCDCKFCENYFSSFKYPNFFDIYNLLNFDNDSHDSIQLKKYLEKEFNLNFNDKIKCLDDLQRIENIFYKKHLNTLQKNFCELLEQKNNTFYFIDSWESHTSNILFENEYFKNKIIPLVGYDENIYLKWSDWEYTFPYRRIQDEFPKTQNGHPTLIQHQYLAKSIIKHIENNFILKYI